MLINPTGLDGKSAAPLVAVVAEVKFIILRKNCCQALVGRFVWPSKNSDCGYGLLWLFVQTPLPELLLVAISYPQLQL